MRLKRTCNVSDALTFTNEKKRSIGARLLIAAWFIDGDHRDLTLDERRLLQQRLADVAWTPDARECARFRLRVLTWAQRYSETELVIRILVPAVEELVADDGGIWM